MENKHRLALYIAYYLARFDKVALKNLGYKNWESSFEDISDKLGVKKHSVRNWRDEFDPLFGYRAGWYQRPMSPSRANIALAMENLEEPELRAIVEDILAGTIQSEAKNLNHLLSISDENEDKYRKSSFILRGPTGKKAEQLFIDYHKLNSLPFAGELIDKREFGCGYDFEIKTETGSYFIEIKGLVNNLGGILFTNKEWETARRERSRYTVCIVSNINDSPEISFINDPFSKLNPKKNIIQTVQVQWSVSNNELQGIND